MDNDRLFTLGLLLFGVGIILSHIIELVRGGGIFPGLMVAGGAGMITVTAHQLMTGNTLYKHPANLWTYILLGGSLLLIAGGLLRLTAFL